MTWCRPASRRGRREPCYSFPARIWTYDKTLLAALASTGEVDKIDIDEIDAIKALVTGGEVAWVCSPLFVKKVEAACDAHSDARLGFLLDFN